MQSKNDIDGQAEREAKALRKQGRYFKPKRLRFTDDYNKVKFDKLFRGN